MRPYRLIEKDGKFWRLDYAHKQPAGSLLHHWQVTGADGLLVAKWKRKPIFKGEILRGGQ